MATLKGGINMKRYCPFIKSDCKGEECMLYQQYINEDGNVTYAECVFVDIATTLRREKLFMELKGKRGN